MYTLKDQNTKQISFGYFILHTKPKLTEPAHV